jgi:hypothetical protein
MTYSMIRDTVSVRTLTAERFARQVDVWPEFPADASWFGYRREATYVYVSSLVVSVYTWLRHDPDCVRDMAFLFETLYFSRALHLRVQDAEEGQRHDKQLQFFVLLGDYYMGQALQLLTDRGAASLISHFSHILAVGSEGMVLHFKYGRPEEETLDKTHGALYQGIFYSADRLRSSEPVEDYARLGYHIGMALELGLRDKPEQLWHQQQLEPLYAALPASHQHPELLRLIREMKILDKNNNV